ncbi:hypothetical protein CapIbe_019911 [Capra ibex]
MTLVAGRGRARAREGRRWSLPPGRRALLGPLLADLPLTPGGAERQPASLRAGPSCDLPGTPRPFPTALSPSPAAALRLFFQKSLASSTSARRSCAVAEPEGETGKTRGTTQLMPSITTCTPAR